MGSNDEHAQYFLRSVSACCTVPKHRLTVLDSLNESDLEKIRDGIVFLHGPYSAQSVIALQTISKLLNEKSFTEIRLFVVDDGNVEIPLATFGKVRIGGFGETLWLRNSHVRKIGSNYDESDLDKLRTITSKVYHEA